jgi:hypothetical protein
LAFIYGLDKDGFKKYESTFDKSREDPSVTHTKKDPIWDYFKDQGFITGFTANFGETGFFMQDKFLNQILLNSPADHEGMSIMCDPHFVDYIQGVNDW